MSMRLTILSAVVVTMTATTARADDVAGAAKAFSQAQQAMVTGEYAQAADLYELADELAPSAPALRNAVRARLAAHHDAMAATLAAELLRRYPNDKESRDIAEEVLSKLSPQLTQFDITCDEACAITLDGKAASPKARTHHLFFAQPGPRTVKAVFDADRRSSKDVNAEPGRTETVRFHAPPRPVAPVASPPAGAAGSAAALTTRAAAPPHHGLSRAWIIGAGVVTVGLGIAAGLQGKATLDTRDQIEAAVADNDAQRAMSLYNDGRDQQLRTNLLLGATAAAGATTLMLAFFTDWSGGSQERQVAVTPTVGGAAVVASGRF